METNDELLSLTESLMRFRTTADRPDALGACAEFVARYFDGTGLVVERIDRNGVPSVVVTRGTKTPRVFLCGHFDVVPGAPHQFEPRRDGGRLYGRGALDMKSGVAAMMWLMRGLAATPHDVGLLLTGDEEVGGFDGVAFLLDRGYGCEAAVIPDGGEAVHRLISKEKGILQVTVSAEGRGAHGSTPWNGRNAIDRLTDALASARSLFVPAARHPEDHWVATLNVGTIEGGEAANQVPSSAVARCDIRFTERDDPDALFARLSEAMPEGVRVTRGLSGSPVDVSPDDPFVAAFADALRRHGREPEYALDHGSSDGRFFSARGIPVLISQPDGAGLHGPEEWVDVRSIGLYAMVLRSFLDAVALPRA